MPLLNTLYADISPSFLVPRFKKMAVMRLTMTYMGATLGATRVRIGPPASHAMVTPFHNVGVVRHLCLMNHVHVSRSSPPSAAPLMEFVVGGGYGMVMILAPYGKSLMCIPSFFSFSVSFLVSVFPMMRLPLYSSLTRCVCMDVLAAALSYKLLASPARSAGVRSMGHV